MKHEFAPGVYLRTITMHAGTLLIGHEHKTEHFNLVWRGKARVVMDGVEQLITGPCRFISKPGVRKVLFILEDMEWSTVHATDETDLEKLEDMMIVRSPTFLAHQAQLKAEAAKPALAEGQST
jgi:hypothetical protein